jgi:hypothetical protein
MAANFASGFHPLRAGGRWINPVLWGDGALRLRSAPKGADVQPREPVLFGSAHVLSVGLDPCSGPAGCYSTGGNACDRLRRRGRPPAFEGVERSRRIAAGTAPDDLNNLLKLARPELGRDLVDAPLIEQQNSRYHGLGYTLRGGPPQRRTIKYDSEGIGHDRNISCTKG